jgi:hypothetical protein
MIVLPAQLPPVVMEYEIPVEAQYEEPEYILVGVVSQLA